MFISAYVINKIMGIRGGAAAKRKGSRFEYETKWALQMVSFYVIRAYSSAGVADLVASPPYNPKGNNKTLLIQCKNTKKLDYVAPFERSHLDYLTQINANNVVLFYKDASNCMVKIWDTQEKMTFEVFMRKEYGIPCDFKELVKSYQSYKRPLHLFSPPKEKSGKFIAPFADLYSVDTFYPHISEKYREKHL